MKILAIGDPHGKVPSNIPRDVNLILVNGDLGSSDLLRKHAFENKERRMKGLPPVKFPPREVKRAFMEAYNTSLKVVRHLSGIAPVYLVYGNVESSNAETKEHSKEIGLSLPLLTDSLKKISNVYVINNRVVNLSGVRVGGLGYFVDTCWVREFKPGDCREKLAEAKEETDKARRALKRFGQVDILLCHQPPYGVLDKVRAKFAPKDWQGKHAGSKIIFDYIKKKQPKYVVCGHIHESAGMKRIGKTEVYNLGVAGYEIIELN